MQERITSNAEQVASALNATAARIGNPTPALERVRSELARGEQQIFSSQGAAIGEHWPPASRPDLKANSALLVDTGALRASLTGAGAGEVHGDTLEFGTDVPYAHFHQHGTGRMPARPFMGITDEARAQILDRLNAALAEDAR